MGIPGVGHIWQRADQGPIFLVALPLPFAIGLRDPRPAVSVLISPAVRLHDRWREFGGGLPYLVGNAVGLGAGQVRAVTYEYGNTFLMTAGLLNLLVVIDAYDIALGRK